MITNVKNWKEYFYKIKNMKLKYRVSLNDTKYKFKVFQQNLNNKSLVNNYIFYN